MKKMFAAGLAAAILASAWMSGAVQAEETETAAGQTAQESGLAQDAPVEIPETRPEYTASDYVDIRNEKYKGIRVSLYPPADDSEEAQSAWQEAVDTQIMTQLFSMYPVNSWPEELMNYVAGNLVETYRQTADMYGMDFSLFLETYLQTDLESFTRQVETAAKQTLAEEMILKAIAEKENITVSDEEFEQGCERYAAQYGYDSADALKQAFDEPTIRISLLMDKTFEFLEGAADIQLIIETETETENGPETETGM